MGGVMTDAWALAEIVGRAWVPVVTGGVFVCSGRPWRLPSWAERGLQYAPIAALTAVVVPEVVMTQGHLIATWQDARIFGAAAGMAMFFWLRNTLLTFVVVMVVYLPFHQGLGW